MYEHTYHSPQQLSLHYPSPQPLSLHYPSCTTTTTPHHTTFPILPLMYHHHYPSPHHFPYTTTHHNNFPYTTPHHNHFPYTTPHHHHLIFPYTTPRPQPHPISSLFSPLTSTSENFTSRLIVAHKPLGYRLQVTGYTVHPTIPHVWVYLISKYYLEPEPRLL